MRGRGISLDNIERRIEQYSRRIGSCLVWTGARRNGYGCLRIGGRKGKTIYVHRYLYEKHRGLDVLNPCVLHKCDTRACIEIEHLYAGTKKDNTRDMLDRNPYVKGELSFLAKLTEEQARTIKYSKEPVKILASRFKVSRQAAADIRYNRTWRHI